MWKRSGNTLVLMFWTPLRRLCFRPVLRQISQECWKNEVRSVCVSFPSVPKSNQRGKQKMIQDFMKFCEFFCVRISSRFWLWFVFVLWFWWISKTVDDSNPTKFLFFLQTEHSVAPIRNEKRKKGKKESKYSLRWRLKLHSLILSQNPKIAVCFQLTDEVSKYPQQAWRKKSGCLGIMKSWIAALKSDTAEFVTTWMEM